jgi:hypothetical protein
MILTIPYQTLEIPNINILPFVVDQKGKNIARMNYKDSSIQFDDVSILTPPMRIISYDPRANKLTVNVDGQKEFISKMNTMQEYLCSTFYEYRHTFLKNKVNNLHQTRELFQNILHGDTMILHIYPATNVRTSDGTKVSIVQLKAGDMIRAVIRIQGVARINKFNSYNGLYDFFLRIYHTIPTMWLITNDGGSSAASNITSGSNSVGGSSVTSSSNSVGGSSPRNNSTIDDINTYI